MNKYFDITSSAAFLIFANLIPLIGVSLWGWDVGSILVLYWLETVIIGIMNIPKLLFAQGAAGSSPPSGIFSKLFLVAFFTVHFGMFNFGHGTFIANMFDAQDQFMGLLSGGPLMLTALVFLISHFMSLMINFFGKGVYKTRDPGTQMFMPYGRVVVLHIVIIIGGGLAMSLGAPVIALAVLIILKTVVDLAIHSVEHKRSALQMTD